MHTYRYQVICNVNGTEIPYSGVLTNLRSESEARARLKSQYRNIIDIEIWEV